MIRHALPATVSLAISVAVGAAGAQDGAPVEQGARNAPALEPAFEGQTRAPAMQSEYSLATETFADGLVHPWGIAALPEGGYLVTERPGRMRHISAEGMLSDPISGIPEVLDERQGGLLDVAIGPDFADSRMIYWTYAKPTGDGMSVTAAARGVLSEDLTSVTEVEDIFVQEPPSPNPMHYGSRIVFDGEGHAFITTGEHFTVEDRQKAQDLASTYGKVIRVAPDGSVPEDNPFVGEEEGFDTIWSYGHRNIQGADINPETGQIWTIEHGPAGGDELNTPEAGKNYGWPVISYGVNYDGTEVGSGEAQREGMEQPRYFWDPVIAPAGMIFYQGEMFPDWQGDLLIGSLTPGALVRIELDGTTVTGEERLLPDIGRVRDVEETPDGALILLIDAAEGSAVRVTRERG